MQRKIINLLSRYMRFYIPAIYIWFCVACSSKREEKEILNPTFTEHIAPLIFKNCSPCHRPGSAGPFDLLSYEDVRSKARTIQLVVNAGSMPPWPADASYTSFRDEKILTTAEKALLNRWVENGAPEGPADRLPPAPQYPSGSLFGQPDYVLQMPAPVKLSGNNKDHFLMMKIPYEFPQDTFIRMIEIVAGNKKLVHHVNAHLVQYEEGEKSDLSSLPFYVNTEKFDKQKAYELLDLPNDDGTYPLLTPSVSNFLPGLEAAAYPQGIGGYRVRKKGFLLLDNIHYGPTPVDTVDYSSFNVFFSPVPPQRPVREFILGTSGISPVEPPLVIEADTIQTFHTSYKIPQAISLLTINPHMHLLGKSFLAYALTPENDTIRLIRIPQWDFRWQYFYTFRKIVHLPKGSVIHVFGEFDNTADNPLNPFHPPQRVSEREGSMRTTDEMFQLIITWMPYQNGDENISLELSENTRLK